MLKSIIFVVGTVAAIQGEKPSVHDMIQNAIHAQTKSKDNDDLGMATGAIMGNASQSPAVKQLAEQFGDEDSQKSISTLLSAQKESGKTASPSIISGVMEGMAAQVASDVEESGSVQNLIQTGLKTQQHNANHKEMSSFLNKLH